MNKRFKDTFISAGFQNENSTLLQAIINLDIICCISIDNGDTYSMYRNKLSEMLYNNGSSTIMDARSILEGFVKTNRKYYKFLIDGRKDLSFGNAFRGTVHSFLLWLISQKRPVVSWKTEVNKYTSELRENWYEKPREEIIDEYIDLFRTVYKDLGLNELEKVCENQKAFANVAERFKKILYSIYEKDGEYLSGNTNLPTYGRIGVENTEKPIDKKSTAFFETKENKINLLCMAEYYLAITQNSTKQSWQVYLYNTWKKFFPGIEISEKIYEELENLLGLVSDSNSDTKKINSNFQRYMRAVGIVINHGNVQNVRSDAVLRSLVLNRTVAMTLSLIDPNKADKKEIEDVLQDVSAYLSYINYVTNKAEEDDLMESLTLYLENGRFSSNSIKKIAQYSDMWKKSFHEMKDYLNSRNKAVSVLNDRIDEMETTLAKSEYNSMKKMVLNLDRGGFGFCLGKLYRFENNLDDLSVREIRELVSCFFNILNNMGIKPADSERLDTIITEQEELFMRCIPETEEAVSENRILSYPGWSVKESIVALPVYKTKEN